MSKRTVQLTFYAGHDNQEELVLLEGQGPDEKVVSTATFTRVVLTLGALVLDSDVVPAAFQFPADLQYEGQPVKGIGLKIGSSPGVEKMDYGICRLVVYDPSYPNGLVWSENFSVTVR